MISIVNQSNPCILEALFPLFYSSHDWLWWVCGVWIRGGGSCGSAGRRCSSHGIRFHERVTLIQSASLSAMLVIFWPCGGHNKKCATKVTLYNKTSKVEIWHWVTETAALRWIGFRHGSDDEKVYLLVQFLQLWYWLQRMNHHWEEMGRWCF